MSWLVGLRDRALMAVMTHTFARIGAIVAMRVEDYYPDGKRWWVRLHEKGGKRHEMPAHHKLEQFLDEYLAAAGIRRDGKTPLFRSAAGKTGRLTENGMHRVDAYQMTRPASPPISRPAVRSKTPRRWPRTKARARPSSMTAPRAAYPRGGGEDFEASE